MGELGLFYKISPISFVAGSLDKNIGGHNIIEAAQLKSAILHGPYMHNFKEVEAIFHENNAAIKTKDTPCSIAENINYLLSHERERRSLAKRAYDIVANMQETLDKIYWPIMMDQEI